MTQEQFQQLIGILGQVGNSAYQAAYARVIYGAVLYAIIQVIILVLGAYIAVRAMRWAIKNKEENEEAALVIGFVTMLISVFFFPMLIGFFSDSIISLITPQYGALKLLADLVIR